jgi:hypothetical protein
MALLSVANPTLEPLGPIADTSTKQIKIVHSKNAHISVSDVNKSVLFLFILNTFLYFINTYYKKVLKNSRNDASHL